MADPVALVSVGATATVAVVVPFVASRLDQARFRVQLNSGRMEELRSVLDSAAVALTNAESTLSSAEDAVERAQATSSTDDQQEFARSSLVDGTRALLRMQEQESRTAVRLGAGNPLLSIYAQARAALRGSLQILEDAATGGPSSDTVAWKAVVHDLYEARQTLHVCRDEFFERAAQLVGPSVPHSL